MIPLPEPVRQAWDQHPGPAVLGTSHPDGALNLVYITCVRLAADGVLVIADNYFDKTRRNILSGSRGSLLFQAVDGKAYQILGRLSRHTDGERFTEMKTWNSAKHPGHAAVVLEPEAVYCGAQKLA